MSVVQLIEVNCENFSIEQNIQEHAAWLGQVSGIQADRLLRNSKRPYLYVLRAGEHKGDYYITFVRPDFTIQHVPFTLSDSSEGWGYSNGGCGGPFKDAVIEDVLHLIMHCRKEEPTAFVKS